MKNITITEYHCCSECANHIQVPGKKPNTWEIGCLNRNGKVNSNGGLTDCKHYQE